MTSFIFVLVPALSADGLDRFLNFGTSMSPASSLSNRSCRTRKLDLGCCKYSALKVDNSALHALHCGWQKLHVYSRYSSIFPTEMCLLIGHNYAEDRNYHLQNIGKKKLMGAIRSNATTRATSWTEGYSSIALSLRLCMCDHFQQLSINTVWLPNHACCEQGKYIFNVPFCGW